MSEATLTWTQDILAWQGWVRLVTDDALTDAHHAVLSAFPPAMAASPYYRVLVNAPMVLEARTRLFNDALRGDTATVGRAEREIAAVGSSRQTGCIYCASVHARAYSGLVHERETVQRVLDEGVHASIPDRERVIVEFSAAIAEKGAALAPTDVQPIRDQGFTDAEIYDIALSAAIFANANRLMLTLGEGVRA
jgi:uncharacterized peroxidase-related enzyme